MNKKLNDEALNNVSGGRDTSVFKTHKWFLKYTDEYGIVHQLISEICRDERESNFAYYDLKRIKDERHWTNATIEIIYLEYKQH